jgi:hypothetical protein
VTVGNGHSWPVFHKIYISSSIYGTNMPIAYGESSKFKKKNIVAAKNT